MNEFLEYQIEEEIEKELILALENVLISWEMGFKPEEDESVHRAARLVLYKAKQYWEKQ